ncbi:MAG: type II toxin-antitoxin system RelE/ParE family toxin [Bacteroidota bacterium]
MEVKVLWSDTSLSQLQEIFDYYNFRVSKTIAKKIVKRIVKKSLILESNPLIGVKEPLLTDRPFEYRFIVENNYKIIYRFQDNIAKIVSVFDCRQNPHKIEQIEEPENGLL